ncbi:MULTISPECIES: STAS domain-containing protein [unclassified Streptomyces]|uniref:STAS domain-containing protein n=1 Tax=unclassified Streptomyces TaxID=2593676 RepID=UPI0038299223
MDATEPIVLVVAGQLTPADVPGLYEDLSTRLTTTVPAGPGKVICDVGGLVRPGLPAVDLLARLHLAARRHGRHLHLRGVPRELGPLLDLVGLGGLIGPSGGGVDPWPDGRDGSGY